MADGYLREEAKRNKSFRLHFNEGDGYGPASSFDIDFAGSLQKGLREYRKETFPHAHEHPDVILEKLLAAREKE